MFEGGIQDNMPTSKEVSLQSFREGAVKAFSFQVCLSTLQTVHKTVIASLTTLITWFYCTYC